MIIRITILRSILQPRKWTMVYSVAQVDFCESFHRSTDRKENVSCTYQRYSEQLLQRLCHVNVTQRYADVIRNILIKSDKPWESDSVPYSHLFARMMYYSYINRLHFNDSYYSIIKFLITSFGNLLGCFWVASFQIYF